MKTAKQLIDESVNPLVNENIKDSFSASEIQYMIRIATGVALCIRG